MDIGPRRRKLLTGIIVFSILLAMSITVTAIDLYEGKIRILTLVGILVFPLFIAGFAMVLSRKPSTLLTLAPEGIHFHLPPFGLVPWSGIASAEIVRSGLFKVRCLGIELKSPPPKASLFLLNMVGIGKKKIAGRERYIFALAQLDRSEAEIETALARLRPGSAGPGSGRMATTGRTS